MRFLVLLFAFLASVIMALPVDHTIGKPSHLCPSRYVLTSLDLASREPGRNNGNGGFKREVLLESRGRNNGNGGFKRDELAERGRNNGNGGFKRDELAERGRNNGNGGF